MRGLTAGDEIALSIRPWPRRALCSTGAPVSGDACDRKRRILVEKCLVGAYNLAHDTNHDARGAGLENHGYSCWLMSCISPQGKGATRTVKYASFTDARYRVDP